MAGFCHGFVPLRRHQVEAAAWIILTVRCLYHQQQQEVAKSNVITAGAASSSLTLLHLLVRLVPWQQGDHQPYDDDTSGLFMSIALGPALLHSIEGKAHYALAMAVVRAFVSGCRQSRNTDSATPVSHHHRGGFRSLQLQLLLLAILGSALFVGRPLNGILPLGWFNHNHQRLVVYGPELWQTTWFVLVWWMLSTSIPQWVVPILSRVVTPGEWWIVSSAGALVLVETVTFLAATATTTTTTNNPTMMDDSIYAVTAVIGVVSCAVSCGLVQILSSSSSSSKHYGTRRMASQRTNDASSSVPWFMVGQLSVMIGLTLGLVEVCFVIFFPHNTRTHSARTFPHCLHWIFGEFLLAPEVQQPLLAAATSTPTLLLKGNWPRWVWLVYWGIVLVVTIPLAPHANTAHPVLARKWFHWIAVLLFVPTTLLVPQLLSLSYAVAVAVLLVLESTRHNVPWLNSFYGTYLDSSKDESADSTIVSHLALIVGCAAPLWLSQWMDASTPSDVDNITTSQQEDMVVRRVLLPLWGVWSLGVGDAMGAMVGKRYGRVHWGYNRRTMEGSLALCVSLSLVCHGTVVMLLIDNTGWSVVHQWMPAVLLVTLLEAFTMQIDNIVLPLAGAAMLLVCTGESG